MPYVIQVMGISIARVKDRMQRRYNLSIGGLGEMKQYTRKGRKRLQNADVGSSRESK